MWGTRYVGSIHGLLLTAWSAAGIFGPVLVDYIREYNRTHGVPKAQAYNTTMYIMPGLLGVGFICNFLVKAVDARFHMKANDARAKESGAAPAAAPAQGRNEHVKTESGRHHDVATCAGLGIRRHSTDARRVADVDQCDEAFPIFV